MTYSVQKTPPASLMKWQSISPHMSLATCMSDCEPLQRNLLASPCLDPRFHHQVAVVKNCRNAGDGLNPGLERAEHEFVVCVHQDVYLPNGWDRCLMEQLEKAERRFGQISPTLPDGSHEYDIQRR
jgi:hypothetical protein